MDYDVSSHVGLRKLARRVASCRLCPRLVKYLRDAHAKWPDHRCKPVPGWGDPNARLVIVGLAPGMHGANKTGRMFTYDSSGTWLYGALHSVGLSSRPVSKTPGDGLRLIDTYITSAGRCAPPQNKPLPAELQACRPFLIEELNLLRRVRVILALGRIAHDAFLTIRGLRKSAYPFSHAGVHLLEDGLTLLDSYHPSRQNTNTGKLTRAMWLGVFRRAKALMDSPPRPTARRGS